MKDRSTVEAKQVTMIYGTDTPYRPERLSERRPEAARAGPESHRLQKAYFAHTGQSKKKIVRPFYQLIDDDAAAIVELCQERPERA